MSLTGADLVAFFRKHPVGVGSGVLAIALGLAAYFRLDLIPAAEAELEQKTSEGERLKANLKHSAQLREQFDAVASANRDIEGRAFRLGQLTANLQYFYRLEAETGTKLIDVRQQSPAPAKGPAPKYLRIPYALSVQGDYAQVVAFLRRLERGPHFCRIVGATVAPAPAVGPEAVTLALNLEILGLP